MSFRIPGRVVFEIILYKGETATCNMCEQLIRSGTVKTGCLCTGKLGMLQPGEYRRLTAEEVKKLNTAAKSNKNAGIESRDGHDNRKTYRR
ncbi:MAG: hypothetical protein ACLR13_00895 [Acutalibacteraceae bacterium]